MISYGKLPIIAVTLIGVILAFIIVFEMKTSDTEKNGNGSQNSNDDELEGLFDE